MDAISWSTAIAVIGSVGTVVLGVMKIWSMKNSSSQSPEKDDIKELLKQLQQQSARCDRHKAELDVLSTKIIELQKDTVRQDNAIEKLHDLLLKLLTDR